MAKLDVIALETSEPKAHTPCEGGSQWHGLAAHLLSVGALARRFASTFGGGNTAFMAGLWHDLGKANPEFQEYLDACQRGLNHERVPHSIWGAAWAYHILFRVLGRHDDWQELAMVILGHHGGLGEPGGVAVKLHSWSKGNHAALELLQLTAQAVPSCDTDQAPSTPERRELWLRMIFSALVDADYLDTESHFQPRQRALRGEWTRPADLWPVFRPDQLRLMWGGRHGGHVNRIRRRIYFHAIRAAKRPPGVFRLTVPTGGGKTRCALAFALRHATEHPKHGFQRVIVALPYTSIIDQTAAEYRRILGDRLVLEHHSQVEPPEAEDQDAAYVRHRLATENWDHPLVVTTTVQLFESLFARKPGRCRKLHNIARSILILDEVQTLPPELAEPTLDALRTLVDDYGVTLILSTATQPAFEQTPYLKAFEGLQIREIAPEPERYFLDPRMMRVEYQPLRQLESLTELADELAGAERAQCLVILNTRKHALQIHELLQARRVKGLFHLSTLLCGAHRKRLLVEIANRLRSDDPKPVRLISTQVVEAGVDLDFPSVYRAMGPLDRIVQAAGRCNREGRRKDKGVVVVFDWPHNRSPPGAYKVGLDAAKILLSRNASERLHDPNIHREYFQYLFRDVDTDREQIQAYRRALDYPAVAKRYKLIDETTPVVIPTYDNGEGERRLAAYVAAPSRAGWRRMLPYVVNLRQTDVTPLAGMLAPVTPGLYCWRGPYDEKTHRGIEADVYDPVDLIQ